MTDHASGNTLAGVLVELIDTRGGEPVVATTNAMGRFDLRIRRSGPFIVRASRIGYQPFESDTLELSTQDLVEMSLQLSVEPISLTPMLVRIDRESNLRGFEDRRFRHVSGTFITRHDIERRPISRPSELLVGIRGVALDMQKDASGIRQDRYIIGLAGSLRPCLAHVFVNGIEFNQTSLITVDDLLNTEWLGGVEVYSTAAAAPAEYQRPGCGSVLFWTKAVEQGGGWHWIKAAVAAGFVVIAAVLTH